jgi:hypothetical protein
MQEKNKLTVEEERTMMCPICGEYRFDGFGDICPVCGWEHDGVQLEFPDEGYGANVLSLDDYRIWFSLKRKLNPNHNWEKSGYEDSNPEKEDLEKLKEKAK